MKKTGAMFGNVFFVCLKLVVLLSFLFSCAGAYAEFKVIAVPKNPSNLNVPHSAYNDKMITFKAIARDDSSVTPPGIAAGSVIEYQWDFDGDMTFEASYTTTDPYNLSGYHTYTGYARDKLLIANVRARIQGSGTDWAYGSYILYLYHDVPAHPNSGQAIIATDQQLAIMRDVAIDDGLWYLHKIVNSRAGSGAAITGRINHDGGRYTAVSAGALWAFQLHGHLAAYPVGTQSVPVNNDINWTKNPYSETVLRLTNYILNTLVSQKIDITDEYNVSDSEDESMRVAGTTNRNSLRCDTALSYDNGIVLGALALSGLQETTVKASNSNVNGKTMEYVVQEIVDWMVWAQNDGGLAEGSWYYTPNAGTDGVYADASATQWGYIGLEAAEKKMGEVGVYVNKKSKYRIPLMLKNNQVASLGCARYRNVGDDYDFQLTGGAIVGGSWLGWDTFPKAGESGANDQPYLPYSTLKKSECRAIFDKYYNYVSKNSNWLAPNSYRTGQYGDGDWWSSNSQGATYAMYSIQKGFRTMKQEPVILTDPNNSSLKHNWFNEYSVYYINNQIFSGTDKKIYGSWSDARPDAWISYSHMFTELTSAFGVLILTPSVFEAKPIAYATANPKNPIEGIAGEKHGYVTFDHHKSFTVDPQRELVAFKWFFNVTVDSSQYDSLNWNSPDYQTSDQSNQPKNRYMYAGTYTAVLRVEDDKGNYSYYTIDDIVVQHIELNPVAIITAVDPSMIQNGVVQVQTSDIAHLTGATSVAYGSVITDYEWDIDNDGAFDDAITTAVDIDVDDPAFGLITGQDLPRRVPVFLRVKDSNGNYSDPVSIDLLIQRIAPTALFYIRPDAPAVNKNIKFY